ncbi:MazG family protein [Actinopolymorpha sp. B17G11]|uniref:MazG family protein n=1 Tax=Actinopolymorpha sp. B17G11 TaxID=3160861 RepID=UPI0032E499F2
MTAEGSDPTPAGRLTLLLTSPRVAPGLLSWPAWELLRRADRVLTDDPDHPQRPPLDAAGIAVEHAFVPAHGAGDPVPAAAAPAPALARWLLDEAASGVELVWLAPDDGAGELGRALAHLLAERADAGASVVPELEVVPASYDLPGARLLDLVAVMDQLRAHCPWVREQTHRSLVRYLVEESYETVEAIETGDRTHLREELGDLLFQVVFHARLAEEGAAGEDGADDGERGETWTIDDVAGDLVEKLIRRNPHVFGETRRETGPGDVAEIENVWDQLKAEEKRRTSAVEGVPLALPALTLADKLLGRTQRTGLAIQGPRVTAAEATGEPLTAERLGELLFALVEQARVAGIDPEQALRDACRRFVAAVEVAEAPPAAGSGEASEGAGGGDAPGP